MKNTASLRRKIPKITEFFDLGKVSKITRIDGANANFLVRTKKGNFFIKIVLEPHTEMNKLSEAEYTRHVIKYGIPAVPYLSSFNGSYVFRNNRIMAMVQSKVSGSNPEITEITVSEIAKFLARLHLVPFAGLSYRYGWLSPEYVEKVNLAKINAGFFRNPHALSILSVYDSCAGFREQILPQLPKSIIHADAHSENVLFKGKKLVAIVDWEDATIAPSLMDFVSSAAYWCFDLDKGIMDPNLYRVFHDSYTIVRPFTELEVEYLAECMKYVGSLQTMWRFLNYPNSEIEDALWGLELAKWVPPSL